MKDPEGSPKAKVGSPKARVRYPDPINEGPPRQAAPKPRYAIRTVLMKEGAPKAKVRYPDSINEGPRSRTLFMKDFPERQPQSQGTLSGPY